MALTLEIVMQIFIAFGFFLYFYSRGYDNENTFSGGFFMLIGSSSFLTLLYLLTDNSLMPIYFTGIIFIFWVYLEIQSLRKMFWGDKDTKDNDD